jgi:NAD(P)-dependent dehydrogenase (short-subunit alcohol dehydrogenase family)
MSVAYDFSGKTAIITGSSRGIGRKIALNLGQSKANVVINFNSDKSASHAQVLVDIIKKAGSNAIAVQGSVADFKSHDKLIDAALKISPSGKIDILIHNAGCGDDATLEQVSEDLYNRIYDTNVKGPIFLTQKVTKYLAKGSRIVFVSSAAARMGVEECTVYGSSKAAIENLIKVWAKELGQKFECTVNAVNPGPVNTDQLFDSSPEQIEFLKELVKDTPTAPRLAETSDIAPFVLFLCSESARWSSGSVLNANGGMCPV